MNRVEMFEKYDNPDPNYIPVNTHWPKCKCCCPAAVLTTPAMTHGDTYPLTFKLNEYIVENYEGRTLTVDILTFRGELVTTLNTVVTDSFAEFDLDSSTYSLLVPDVYYLVLRLHSEDEVYTLYDRASPCLTIT